MKRMDRKKIIKGLEMCLADEYCNGCPYEEDCFDPDSDNPWGSGVMRDALAMLKEQERIIKLYEKAEPFLHSHGWDWTQVEGWIKANENNSIMET